MIHIVECLLEYFRYTDFIIPPDNLNQTHDLFPDKFMLGSEACAGYIPGAPNKGVLLGSWYRGERYSENIIEVRNYQV